MVIRSSFKKRIELQSTGQLESVPLIISFFNTLTTSNIIGSFLQPYRQLEGSYNT